MPSARALHRLLAFTLAAWMALLPVLGTMAMTHGAIDGLRAPATTRLAELKDAAHDHAADAHGHRHAHGDHLGLPGKAAHADAFAAFVHDLTHAWECCAQTAAALPLLLHRLPALRPEAPASPQTTPVIGARIGTLFRPPIR